MTSRILIVVAAVLVAAGCAPDPDTGSVLRRGNGGDPGSLDPALAQDEHAFNVIADLYEGLVAYDARGAIVPGVAEHWQTSDDELTWTFTLRDDARWSDGSPVTAGDFVAAFRRVADPAMGAPLASLLDTIESAHAPATRTLVIELAAPTPQFLSVLAMAVAAPHRQGHGGQALTNGPFVLDAWLPGEVIRLLRNPLFHAADDVHLDRVEFYPIADPATELTRYRAGELDVTATVPPASLDALRDTRAAELQIAPRLAVYYLALDLTEPPLDDPALRQALSRAIDRETLVRLLGRGEQPAYGFVPGGIAGYAPARYDWQGEPPAVELPASIGLLYDAGDIHEKVALAVAAMWRETPGIEVALDKREWQYFLATRERRDEWQVMRFAWTGDYAHPKAFLDLFLADSPMNLPGYANPEFDRLVGEGAYAQAEALLLADYPVIPLYFYVSKHLVSPRVAGFEANPLDLHPSRYLSLADD